MVTLTLPGQVLLGLYLGMLTGVIPALIAFAFGFGFRYVTGVTIPAFAVVVLALALAGVNGGLMALADPMITEQANSVTLMTAVVIVLMLSFYTHAQGDKLAVTVPHRLTLSRLRDTTVSSEVINFVGGRGQVRVEVVGDVRDMEGYPPLTDRLRTDVGEATYTYPADLPVSELESRLAERLRSAFDLQDVHVSMDDRGRASVAAAPPSAGVSNRIPSGHRGVSVDALVPTGIARGDVVSVLTDGQEIEGTILSARSGEPAVAEIEESSTEHDPEDGDLEPAPPRNEAAPTTTGGEGRVTVSVPSDRVDDLLSGNDARLIVRSRGIRREFELLSLLRRSGQRMRRLTVGTDGPLDGVTLGDAAVRDTYNVAILALRTDGQWVIAPRGEAELEAGDEVFAVGTSSNVARFREAVA